MAKKIQTQIQHKTPEQLQKEREEYDTVLDNRIGEDRPYPHDKSSADSTKEHKEKGKSNNYHRPLPFGDFF